MLGITEEARRGPVLPRGSLGCNALERSLVEPISS